MNLDSFKEKYGPLPIWGWSVIIAVGGYVVYRYYKSKSTAQQSTQQDQAVTTGVNLPNVPSNMMVEDPALMDQLNTTNAGLATLATNVGKQTTATESNTTALNSNTSAVNTNTVGPSGIGHYLGGTWYYLVGGNGKGGFDPGSHWEVVNGKRYRVSGSTWAKVRASGVLPKGGPWYTEVTPADPIFKLPFGGTI